jgi:hypothetical protein
MSKISKRGQTRHRARRGDYYSKMRRDQDETSPVDQAVERRLRHAAQRRHIRRLMEKLVNELGGSSKTLVELEALVADVQTERERVYFNIGFEQGVAAALARSRLEPVLDKVAVQLATDLRERVVHAGLSEPQVTLALVDVLWAVAAARRVPAPDR